MIIFREKDFSNLNSRSGQLEYLVEGCHTIALELIKAIDFYWYSPENVNHWIDKTTGYLYKMVGKEYIFPHFGLLCSFQHKNISNLIGLDGLSKVIEKYKSPEDFILSVENEILVSKKYDTWIKDISFFRQTKDYLKIFKYISLCLSGNINPNDWDTQWEWINKDIPFNGKILFPKSSIGQKEIWEIIKSCIDIINGQ